MLSLVAEGIYQLRLPLPFALNSVNVYLLPSAQGWTIVDTGIHTAAGEASWQSAFAELQLRPRDIQQIILTHVHPDHYGMAGWLQSLGAAEGKTIPVYTSEREALQARQVWLNFQFDYVTWLTQAGMPQEFIPQTAVGMRETRAMTLPDPNLVGCLKAGEMLQMGERQFQILQAAGHSDGHLLFYDAADKLMLSGDHILMKITPNIGLWQQSDPNPLVRFLDSLADLQKLDVRLALPGHKSLIHDWQGRIRELEAHHAERLDHCLAAIRTGQHSPYQIAQMIFSSERFTVHEWRFAIAETLAHLDYLVRQGKVIQAEQQQIYEIV